MNNNKGENKTVFYEPQQEDIRELALRWVSISNLIKEKYEYELNQSSNDLNYCQRVIDDNLIDFNNGYAVECIGVAFGRVLANNIPDLDWWIIEDEFGRDLTIRYKNTSLRFNVIHMVKRRLMEGIMVNLNDMYKWIIDTLNELKDKVD